MKLSLLSLIMKTLHTLGHLYNIRRIGLRTFCSYYVQLIKYVILFPLISQIAGAKNKLND